MAYNDYIIITKNYLKTYREKQLALSNLKSELKEKNIEQGLEAVAPIAKYSDEPGGGQNELNVVEMAASKHIELSREVYQLMVEVGELSRWLKRMNTALENLQDEERTIVEYKYISRMSWLDVADRAYMSERKARYTGEKAVKSIAYMLFGSRALGPGEYVFMRQDNSQY